MLIKVCGLRRQQDIDLCIRAGVDFCGFVFHRASKRFVEPIEVGRLESGPCQRVGVFTSHDADEILREAEVAKVHWLQLHGNQSDDIVHAVGAQRVIRVWTPQATWSIDHPGTPYVLLDSGYGTGQCLDWKGLNLPSVPYFIAGGLSLETIPQLLRYCQPHGVDLNSGVESAPGVKDDTKLLTTVQWIKKHEK